MNIKNLFRALLDVHAQGTSIQRLGRIPEAALAEVKHGNIPGNLDSMDPDWGRNQLGIRLA